MLLSFGIHVSESTTYHEFAEHHSVHSSKFLVYTTCKCESKSLQAKRSYYAAHSVHSVQQATKTVSTRERQLGLAVLSAQDHTPKLAVHSTS
jgi:hypothetical protein